MRKTLLVAAAAVMLAASTLSAQGWGPDIRLTNDPAESYNSYNAGRSIAVSNNNVYAVWYDGRDGNYEIYYKHSGDGGFSWDSDYRITYESHDSYHPSIGVSGDNIHVVWHDDRDGNREIYYTRSSDGGSHWSPDTGLTSDAAYSWRPTIAVSGDTIHVVWQEARDGNQEVYYKRSEDNGENWTDDIRLTDNSASSESPSVAVAGSNVYVVWQDGRDGGSYPNNRKIYYMHSDDNGYNWSEDTKLSTGGNGSFGASVAAYDNNVHVVWHDNRDHGGSTWNIYYKRSTDCGCNWDNDKALFNTTTRAGGAAVDAFEDAVHVVWHDERNGNWEIYHKNSEDNGTTWGSDFRITNESHTSLRSSIAIAGKNANIIWEDTRDGNSEIYYTKYLGEGEGSLAWQYKIGDGRVFSSPAIEDNGTIYVGSYEGYLYALNPDGSVKWSYQTGNRVESTPAIDSDGTIYVGSYDGYLYALDLQGNLKWRYQTNGVISSSPAIASDGTIYIGSWDWYLHAVNPDGSLKWKYKTGNEISSPPSIGRDETVYFGSCDNYLYALNPDNTLKWKYQTGNDIGASPAIGEDGTIYFGSWDSYFYALNPDGSLKWKYLTGGAVGSPAIGPDETVYFPSGDDYLYAFSPSGFLLWKYLTEDNAGSCPAVGSDGKVYFGSKDKYLYALSSAGDLEWRYLTGGAIASCPSIDSSGKVYFGSYDGYLYAVYCSSQGLAESSWPKFRHDLKNTGRVPVLDVGPISIDAPSDTVWSEHVYIPQATVENFEAEPVSFEVVCEFDSSGSIVYADTVTVIDLVGGATEQVSFADWTSGEGDGLLYTMSVTTLLDGDINPDNDTLSKTVTAVWPPRDVAPVSIITPPDFVWVGLAHTPRVIVANLWKEAESFDVSCEIDSAGTIAYSNSANVINLDGGDSVQVEFEPWSSGAADEFTYTMKVFTQLEKDLNPDNDTISKHIHSVRAVADLDIQDYSGNLSANIMELTGVRNSVVVGSYVMVNPDNWEKNVDLYDGPANVDLDLSYSWTDLTTYDGRGSISSDNVDPNVNALASLALGDGALNIVQVYIPKHKVRTEETYVGKVTVTGEGEGSVNADEFGLKVIVVPGFKCRGFSGEPLAEGNQLYWSEFGFGETGFNLYRARAESEEYLRLAEIPVTQTEFTDHDVYAEEEYSYRLGMVMSDDKEILIGPLSISASEEVGYIVLYESWPNPWSELTEISYYIPRDMVSASLKVYDISGMLVKTLVDGPMDAGGHTMVWDGTDERGLAVSSGVYFCRLQADDQRQITKTVLLR